MNEQELQELRQRIGNIIIAEIFSQSKIECYKRIINRFEAKGRQVREKDRMTADGSLRLFRNASKRMNGFNGILFGFGNILVPEMERDLKEDKYSRFLIRKIQLNETGNPIIFGDASILEVYDSVGTKLVPGQLEILKLTEEMPYGVDWMPV